MSIDEMHRNLKGIQSDLEQERAKADRAEKLMTRIFEKYALPALMTRVREEPYRVRLSLTEEFVERRQEYSKVTYMVEAQKVPADMYYSQFSEVQTDPTFNTHWITCGTFKTEKRS